MPSLGNRFDSRFYGVHMKPRTKIYLSGNPGRLCNCLEAGARIAAFCEEFGFDLIDINLIRFKGITASIPGVLHESLVQHNSIKKTVVKAYVEMMHMTGVRSVDLVPSRIAFVKSFARRKLFRNFEEKKRLRLDHSIGNLIQKNRVFFLRGYLFSLDYDIYNKNIDSIRRRFAFAPALIGSVSHFLRQSISTQDTIKVAVHIRRTDYKYYRDGRFYFDHLDYAKWMRQMVKLLPDKNVQFFICSDENIQSCSDVYSGLNWIASCGDNPFFDLALMSQMDYIIGPPSSFSGWSSFMGQVPIVHLENKSETLDLERFKKHEINW